MTTKKSHAKTGTVGVPRNPRPMESDHENHADQDPPIVNDYFSPALAWASIQANFGLALPVIAIEHLYDADDGLGWEENSGKPGVTKLDSFASAVRRTGLGYLRLRDRVRARALVELPLADHELVPTLVGAGCMVDEAFHEAIVETEHALYRRPIWLDYFADCIYPVVKQKLQAKLGLAIEPATVFQTWLLDIEG